jgi:hypothetical protein
MASSEGRGRGSLRVGSDVVHNPARELAPDVVDADDERVVHDVEVLQDGKHVDTSISTEPVGRRRGTAYGEELGVVSQSAEHDPARVFTDVVRSSPEIYRSNQADQSRPF